MRRLGSVQQKVPCVFLTEVREEQSRKRDGQNFQVVATEMLNPLALEACVDCALATEKVDGTCCYVAPYKGQPSLWARLDRRPNKQAEKRFRKHQQIHRSGRGFCWNLDDDFKAVPETWIPAHGVQHQNGRPLPDEHGHIPGWVPVERDNKQYCWHSSVVDYQRGAALLLRPAADKEDALELAAAPLADLQEQTLELIGTNVNGNPYGLGSKKQPVHCLLSHGSLRIRCAPAADLQRLRSWFLESPEGRVEGVVWHCRDGTLFKVHRHHLGLRWPDGETALGGRPVAVRVGDASEGRGLLSSFSRINGRRFGRLQDIQYEP